MKLNEIEYLIKTNVHYLHVPTPMQGATKTVSTCPRQVVLASGQVGCQSYLSFGQVNESQKIIFKKNVF